ncbi:MAG: molybdopterin-dependent oxidoreductase [Proteobacteria bacterium]|nr:molybdopterin-dependent oxidoreductase [Pseudomonadota bacterium]MBU1697074.1 molybdopterin-dependent oxidoreductase [Pseudomonadota bacterium]
MTFRKKQEPIGEYDSIRRTTCCNCPTGCGLKVFLKGGAIAGMYGDEEHPVNKGSLCPKGLLSNYHLQNTKRLVHPQIRRSLKDPFQVVSWEEALCFTTENLQEISDRKGKDSICIYGDESAPFDFFAGASLFAEHFGIPNTPSQFLPLPFSSNGQIRNMFGVQGSQLLMNSQRDWCNSRCILLYGCDLANSDPITFGSIIDARDRGSTLLVIDSKKTITTSKASHSLIVKPGTQSLVLKGILNLLIQRGFIDESFLGEVVRDFNSMKSRVRPFTPQSVAESCWIKKEDLEKAVDLIGRVQPVQVMAGDWISQRHLSEEDLLMCGALVCLRGSVGIPGGGLNLLNVSPFSWEDLFQNNGKTQPKKEISRHLSLENILLDQENKLDAMIWYGNPCAKIREGNKTKSALKDVSFIAHLSSYPDETFHHSHVSFPMSSWLEYSGLVANNNGRALQWHHQVVAPRAECKSSFEFWFDLANSLGLGETFPWKEKDGLTAASETINYLLKQNPLTRSVSIEKLDPEQNPPGGLLWPCMEPEDLEFETTRFLIGRQGNVRGKNILFQQKKQPALDDKRFPTLDGKISFSCFNEVEGKEVKKGVNKNFPLILITIPLVDFVKEWGYFVSDRDIWTKDTIFQIHPQLAEILNIKSGENISVENEQGSITAPIQLNEDVDPRVVWCPDGIDPYQPHFSCESPYSLFKAPDSDEFIRPFTMVTLYRQGEDRIKNKNKVIEFLNMLEKRASVN